MGRRKKKISKLDLGSDEDRWDKAAESALRVNLGSTFKCLPFILVNIGSRREGFGRYSASEMEEPDDLKKKFLIVKVTLNWQANDFAINYGNPVRWLPRKLWWKQAKKVNWRRPIEIWPAKNEEQTVCSSVCKKATCLTLAQVHLVSVRRMLT